MSDFIESYRGSVRTWECDTTEHLTVAYYFERFSDAVLLLMEHHGIGFDYMREQRRGNATVDCHVRYQEELRVGDPLHIESALIGVDEKGLLAGHRVYNSATGALCTTLEQRLIHIDMDARRATPMAAPLVKRLSAAVVPWDGPAREPRPEPQGEAGFIDTYRDSTKPWEIDVVGHVGFQFYVHRFSAAGAQLFTAMGLTPANQRDQRLGFSTFEFQLRFRRELNAGDLVHMKSALLHLGSSSVLIQHNLYNSRSGELSAALKQYGVLLDLDARRPKRFPEELRGRAEALLVPAA